MKADSLRHIDTVSHDGRPMRSSAGAGPRIAVRRPPLERAGAAGVLLLVTLLLSLAPARAGLAHDPWPPAVASRLLDLSPTVLVMECAGSDWMRHPLVYEPVGSDRFERRAWRGTLAGPTLLLVGYLFAAGAYLASRRFLDRDVRAPGAG